MSQTFDRIEDFIPELKSEAFISGLEAAVNHTKKTGYETHFRVVFDEELGFIYPDEIDVGDEKRASIQKGAVRARKFLNEHLGIQPSAESATEDLRLLKTYSEEPFFAYPVTPDWEERNLLSAMIRSDASLIGLKELIVMHTHPSGRSTPSTGDLRCLNYIRRRAENYSPIFLIADVTQLAVSYPFQIIQEKTQEPIPEHTDFARLAIAIGFSYSNLISIFSEGTPQKKKSEVARAFANKFYNVKSGNYSQQKGLILR